MTKIISIDESKCDGCGLCVNACHEGALALVDGKAKLVKPNFCDGMGDCLPACPQGAISFVEEDPVGSVHLGPGIPVSGIPMSHPNAITIPGEQWPIQLALVSARSEVLKGRLVIAADCTAFKVDGFKQKFVGKDPMVIGCPKLDDRERFDKFIEIFRNNPIDQVEIVRMEVPCCSALTRLVKASIQMSGRDIPVKETVIARDGRVISTSDRAHAVEL